MDTGNTECFPVAVQIVMDHLDFHSMQMVFMRTEIEPDLVDTQTLFACSRIIMFAMPFWRQVPIKRKQGIANHTTDPTTSCDCLSDVSRSEVELYSTRVSEIFQVDVVVSNISPIIVETAYVTPHFVYECEVESVAVE